MGKLVIAALVGIVGIALWLLPLFSSGSVPKMDPNAWWGPTELKGKVDNSIKPFKVKFSDELIKDLRYRLKNHRKLAPPLEGVGFAYGFNTNQVDVWTKYWAEEYNFAEREKFFNQFPQFKTNIQGLDIHFIRVKPQVPAGVKIIPLLLLHGWPGSVREFYEAIPLLTKQNPGYDFAFEVIVPSLPGYGFSDPAVRPGLGPGEIGMIFKNLMNRLGFEKFYIQGGDWGAVIASAMATLFQDEVLGHHNNMMVIMTTGAYLRMFIGAYIPSLIIESDMWDRMYPLTKYFGHYVEELGYLHLQATKPDTVGVALTDSPVGLLTYMLEKFGAWTRMEHRLLPDNGITRDFSRDQLIDNLMVYWTANCVTSSMRLYAEVLGNRNRELYLDGYSTKVPSWGLQPKHELYYQPPNILKLKYTNLLGVTVLDDGGHFFAFQKPQLFAKDVYKAVNEFIAWHKRKTEFIADRIMGKLIAIIILVIIGIATWVLVPSLFPGAPPQLDANEWWGPQGLRGKQDVTIRPFQVKFPLEMINDLKARLKNHRQFVPPLENVGFEYGFNTKQIDPWVKYWSEQYNFTERERFFNKFSQFKTNIQGLDIHFIRYKPQVPAGVETVPLLLMHGWPGSVREFYEAIPLLAAHRQGYDFAFEVIVPSLPGYGFSDPAVRPGLGAAQVGVIFKNLMNRLGHKKFYIQGGDWGATIGSVMVTMYQNEILGLHSNMLVTQNSRSQILTLVGSIFPSLVVDSHLASRMYPLSNYFAYLMEEFGYMHLQATKPDTIGVALSDSPVGLLSYFLEKFSTWTRFEHKSLTDGGLNFAFSKDQLIDNLMVYWSTNSITTSMRLYAESLSNSHRALVFDECQTSVPIWALQGKNELFYQSPIILKTKFVNLLGVSAEDEGGHFFAFEKPKVFAEDVFKAVKKFREWHKTKTEL